MSELDVRLAALFRAVFAGLNEQNVRDATRDSVAKWDSIAAVTLLTLMEEEFGEQFDLEEAAEWTSYAQIREMLEKRLHG
jgi:acyl carrier protein